MVDNKTRCAWVSPDPIYIAYHDKEWGRPIYDSARLFEFLILEGMQAGLSWLTVLKKREAFRACFDGFDPNKMARYTSNKIERFMQEAGIIRHRLKLVSAVSNAKAYLALEAGGQDFSTYLWSFVDNVPIQNHWASVESVPASTLLSDRLSRDLKARGFRFVGSTICYAFMQAVGMVNDHTTDCFCYGC